jgi:hypothetical protein
VFVTGFSQGSFAALGLARALAQGADGRFRLSGVRARMVDLGDVDHLGSNRRAAVRVLRFFMGVAE